MEEVAKSFSTVDQEGHVSIPLFFCVQKSPTKVLDFLSPIRYALFKTERVEMQKKQFDSDAPPTRIGKLVSDKMEEGGLSIRDLAAKLDITYEHVRRIVRGEGVPSKFVLKAICEALGLNFKEAEKMATADRAHAKYGDAFLELAGKEPELEPLERVWSDLSEEQKRNILSMAQAWARSNRRAAS